MAWESKHGDISLFPNDNKTKDNQPDWRGKITLDGKDYDIALWNKTSSKSGTSFLSGRMGEESKPKTASAWGSNSSQPRQQPQQQQQQFASNFDLDDSLPF
jgi:hypothetical protein